MAKNSIRDYSATNSSNTDIQSIDISEGCSPAGINNAIREVMADLKDVSTGAVALESPAADSLSVTGDLTVDTNTLYVDSTNNRVGLGTSSPDTKFTISGNANLTGNFYTPDYGYIGNSAGTFSGINTGFQTLSGGSGYLTAYTNGSERLRIDSSGNLLVGKTSAGLSNVGFQALPSGVVGITRSGSNPLDLNRLSSDGTLIEFNKDGTAVGSIGTPFANELYIAASGTNSSGILLTQSNQVRPMKNGSASDDTQDLGATNGRWDDIYATNGTIQTSDANEKQQIAELTDAEITAAKAISALFKTYKWNSAVTEKGDAARTHTGVIAQDVQAAMTAAGLDAGDYAFFISSTWWETQTEVPAVEAVEAVYEDVVIPAVLDEDGNEVEAERTEQRTVTEAVEAVAAYTRTDTYDTAEEAPEGAVERTRLGIRYPELLAFVGAATEQRLANIETRLAALEAN